MSKRECVLSEWSQWSECDRKCGGGKQIRTRGILTYPAFGGTNCPTELLQMQDCNTLTCTDDCQLTDWSDWSQCDKPCGPGKQFRTKSVLQEAKNKGRACSTYNLYETKDCQVKECPLTKSDDCLVSDWTDWSLCSKDCDGGIKTRTRRIISEGTTKGKKCPVLSENTSCNNIKCDIDCVLSEWSPWSECDTPCGDGEQTRFRKPLVFSKNNGKRCDPNLFETKKCNNKPCGKDCVVSNWSAWSLCSNNCGPGIKTRTRKIKQEASTGGKNCPKILSETIPCNEGPCPIDCKVSDWSSWSKCNPKCNGQQIRTRNILVKPEYNGMDCPILSETINCSEPDCPQDCIVSAWSNWSTCDNNCGSNKKRTRTVLKPFSNGGIGCPILSETESCGNPCPKTS